MASFSFPEPQLEAGKQILGNWSLHGIEENLLNRPQLRVFDFGMPLNRGLSSLDFLWLPIGFNDHP